MGIGHSGLSFPLQKPDAAALATFWNVQAAHGHKAGMNQHTWEEGLGFDGLGCNPKVGLEYGFRSCRVQC